MSLIERALKKMQRGENVQPARLRVATQATDDGEPKTVDTQDVARGLRSAASVTLDIASLRRQGLLAPESHERVMMQQYRRIKRPLVTNAFGREAASIPNSRLLAVTSALPGEGKTFTSFNLALNLAIEQDTQVLLVDADVAKRSLSSELGIADKPGLLDVIEDHDSELQSAVLATDVPGFFLLPSGHHRENSVELLESARLKKLLRQLLADVRQCIVVFDTPPLLLTAESRAVAGIAGQIVLVVKAGVTSRAEVTEAAGLIPQDKKYVACILNQSEPKADSELYGYYPTNEPLS
jgi:protein-tyrosine kinase